MLPCILQAKMSDVHLVPSWQGSFGRQWASQGQLKAHTEGQDSLVSGGAEPARLMAECRVWTTTWSTGE